MRAAYAQAELTPDAIDYVECHATGTNVGDGTEIRSMARVFGEQRPLPIGSVKSNMGHTSLLPPVLPVCSKCCQPSRKKRCRPPFMSTSRR